MQFLTYPDLRDLLAEVGISISDVARYGGLSIGVAGWNDDSEVVLVVTTFARDRHGKRYADRGTNEAATEVRRFPLTSLGIGQSASAETPLPV